MTAIHEAQTLARPKIQPVNIANAIAYVVNLVVTYGVMASDRFPSNAEVSDKYLTLVTPAGYAFGIWGIIFTSELIWTIVQLLPAYRANALVVSGAGFKYVAVCLAQAAWTFFFTAEKIVLSLVAMVSILIPLFFIVNAKIAHRSLKDFWLLKFPFALHFGWILAATFVNINVVLVSQGASADVQYYSALASLVILAAAAFYYSFERQYTIPSVVVWASYGIRVALSNAPTTFVLFHGSKHVDNMKNGAGLLALVSAIALVLSFLKEKLSENTRRGSSDDDAGAAEYTPLNE